jgi:CheY-like chemotaxis protein
MNLLLNAGQAIVGRGDVWIKTSSNLENATIAIKDNGCGIADKDLSKIFDPFFTTKEVGGGTGLGLSITYGIVKKHGGTIHVASEVGKGTEFIVELPVRLHGGRGDARYGLLIVDDEKDILKTLSLTFEEDYEVFTATSGAEALKILDNDEIALIIADQRMPEMTGVEFLEKTVAKYPHIIRMILTAYPDTESLMQAINAGRVYRYITKPWDRAELKIAVKRASPWRISGC